MEKRKKDSAKSQGKFKSVIRWISYFFLFIIFLIFLGAFFGSNNIFSASEISNSTYYIKFTYNISDGTLTEEMLFTGNTGGKSYYGQINVPNYVLGELLSWNQTGGKPCDALESAESSVSGRSSTYFYCRYGENGFSDGDYFLIQIVSKYPAGTYRGGLNLFVYPADVILYPNSEGSLEHIIHVPKGYYLFNSSINVSMRSANGATIIYFKEALKGGESISSKHGSPPIIHLKKKVDFSSIKSLKSGVISLNYPSGFEEEAKALLNELNKVMPGFEKYSGGKVYENIIINLVENESLLNGYGGQAYPSLRSAENIDYLNISINVINSPVPFHELCHLSQKKLNYPSWFKEGQADNCAILLLKSIGRERDAEWQDGFRINSTKAASPMISLHDWVPANTTNEKDNLTLKSYGLSYMLMKEVFPFVDIPRFYSIMRSSFKGNFLLSNDAVICNLNKAAKSDIIPIFEKHGFKVGDCTEIKSCGSSQVFGENMECFDYCDTYFCKSKEIDIGPNNPCPDGYGMSSEDGKCHRICSGDSEASTYCYFGDFCFKNKCISCPKGTTLYENGYCY